MQKFFTRINAEGNSESIELDLNIYHHLPEHFENYLLWLFIKSDTITDVEETIIERLKKSHKAIPIAKKEVDGWSELYFYAPREKGFTIAVDDILKSRHYIYEAGSYRDDKFKVYLENLYPTELEFHQIESRHIIETLAAEGDDVTQPREVEHYMFFHTDANRERFNASIEMLGFTIKENFYDDEAEYSYGVIATKEHDVTLERVQNEIADLLEKIYVEHGYYKGWSTTLHA